MELKSIFWCKKFVKSLPSFLSYAFSHKVSEIISCSVTVQIWTGNKICFWVFEMLFKKYTMYRKSLDLNYDIKI